MTWRNWRMRRNAWRPFVSTLHSPFGYLTIEPCLDQERIADAIKYFEIYLKKEISTRAWSLKSRRCWRLKERRNEGITM
jgi:hypothetical protein